MLSRTPEAACKQPEVIHKGPSWVPPPGDWEVPTLEGLLLLLLEDVWDAGRLADLGVDEGVHGLEAMARMPTRRAALLITRKAKTATTKLNVLRLANWADLSVIICWRSSICSLRGILNGRLYDMK